MLVGGVLVFVYVFTDIAKAPDWRFLVGGALLIGLGIYLWWRSPLPPPPPSGRFSALKKKEKKQDKKK